jgi:regulator of RNase E activity RraA
MSAAAKDALSSVSTATLTSQLLKRGFRNTFMAGLMPHRPDLRMVGRAFTLRYAPAREDRAGFQVDYDNTTNVQRLAVEAIGEGQVLVIDARQDVRSASFGEILATRISVRGAAGLVTDGCLRDAPAFQKIEIPSYSRGAHATTSSVLHFPVEMNVTIGCAGVLVEPYDVIVGDAEGVVVIPREIANEVAEGAIEQETLEAFSLERVRNGESIVDVYPLAPHRRAEYQAWLAERRAEGGK